MRSENGDHSTSTDAAGVASRIVLEAPSFVRGGWTASCPAEREESAQEHGATGQRHVGGGTVRISPSATSAGDDRLYACRQHRVRDRSRTRNAVTGSSPCVQRAAWFNPQAVDRMRGDRSMTERILNVLRPYASNWTGTLGRGDLVIPQREIPRVIHEILDALRDETADKEASEHELFDVLMSARRSPSVQDQVNHLRRRFRILQR